MKTLGEARCERDDHPDEGDGACACGAVTWYLEEADEPEAEPEKVQTAALVDCPICHMWIDVPVTVRTLRSTDGPLTLIVDGAKATEHRCPPSTPA